MECPANLYARLNRQPWDRPGHGDNVKHMFESKH